MHVSHSPILRKLNQINELTPPSTNSRVGSYDLGDPKLPNLLIPQLFPPSTHYSFPHQPIFLQVIQFSNYFTPDVSNQPWLFVSGCARYSMIVVNDLGDEYVAASISIWRISRFYHGKQLRIRRGRFLHCRQEIEWKLIIDFQVLFSPTGGLF